MNVPWRLLNKQVKLEKKNAAMIVFFRIICYSRKKQMSRQLIWFVIMKFDSTGTSVLFCLISRQCVSCSAPFFFPGDTRLRRRWNPRGANTKQSRRDVNSMHHLRRCVTNRLPGSAALKTAIGRGKININFTRCAKIIHILVWNNGHTLCLCRAVLHAVLLISYFAVFPLHPSSLSLLYKGNAIWNNL